MSKQNKRNEQLEKKIDARVKDRGDSKTFNNANIRPRKNENILKVAYPDGDSRKVSTNTKLAKPKVNIVMKLPIKDETKPIYDTEDGKPATDRKLIAKEAEKKAVMELKRIREKYPVKLKSSNVPTSQVLKDDVDEPICVKSDIKNFTPETITKPQESAHAKENDTTFEPLPKHSSEDKDKKEQINTGKKPVIKTVIAKNASVPIYKAVTFEQKRKKTELNISIPNPATYTNKQNASKCTDTSSLTPVNVIVNVREKQPPVRRKSPRRRELKKYRRIESPTPVCDFRNNRSPSTEVAKWAPSSVSQETQPYYEAWVNTRLAATSLQNHDQSYFNEQEFLKTFKKALERPATPDLLYYNFTDERYTGRIKIRQK